MGQWVGLSAAATHPSPGVNKSNAIRLGLIIPIGGGQAAEPGRSVPVCRGVFISCALRLLSSRSFLSCASFRHRDNNRKERLRSSIRYLAWKPINKMALSVPARHMSHLEIATTHRQMVLVTSPQGWSQHQHQQACLGSFMCSTRDQKFQKGEKKGCGPSSTNFFPHPTMAIGGCPESVGVPLRFLCSTWPLLLLPLTGTWANKRRIKESQSRLPLSQMLEPGTPRDTCVRRRRSHRDRG